MEIRITSIMNIYILFADALDELCCNVDNIDLDDEEEEYSDEEEYYGNSDDLRHFCKNHIIPRTIVARCS